MCYCAGQGSFPSLMSSLCLIEQFDQLYLVNRFEKIVACAHLQGIQKRLERRVGRNEEDLCARVSPFRQAE